jgi:hypothetical protein
MADKVVVCCQYHALHDVVEKERYCYFWQCCASTAVHMAFVWAHSLLAGAGSWAAVGNLSQ